MYARHSLCDAKILELPISSSDNKVEIRSHCHVQMIKINASSCLKVILGIFYGALYMEGIPIILANRTWNFKLGNPILFVVLSSLIICGQVMKLRIQLFKDHYRKHPSILHDTYFEELSLNFKLVIPPKGTYFYFHKFSVPL
ncbi:unnamed protein product [Gordionus sp. m RMFG-2023]